MTENHRTETQHQRHLVHKMIVFEIANSFSVLFYTAFVLNDFKLLQEVDYLEIILKIFAKF